MVLDHNRTDTKAGQKFRAANLINPLINTISLRGLPTYNLTLPLNLMFYVRLKIDFLLEKPLFSSAFQLFYEKIALMKSIIPF